jgi:hypothetical protein
MFRTGGGGGFGLPVGDSPLELAVMLLVVLGILWLVFKIFTS